MRSVAPLMLLAALVCLPAFGAVPWAGTGWVVEAAESRVESYQGRDALVLVNGSAWLDGANFQDGVIEFDLAVPESQGFHGVAFRAANRENFEHVYVRPHQSGNQDATQVQPVFNGSASWQIYSGERYAQAVELIPDRWMHVRIVAAGKTLSLSIDGQTLVFPDLVRPLQRGGIGLNSSTSLARFANVVIRHSVPPELVPEGGAAAPALPPGLIRTWRVSSPFAEERVRGLDVLDAKEWNSASWKQVTVGDNGIANLAIAYKRTAEKNTVIAETTIRSEAPRPALLRFGFSDRVVVFINGRPVYRGADKWRSRDYRFLGTIGLFDEVILPLERGENQIWLAVSEDFGGWGVMGEIVEQGP